MDLSTYLTSVLRTVVPSAWGVLVAYLVATGLLPEVLAADALRVAEVLLVPVAIGVYYALVRLVEPHLPPLLSGLLLGSSRAPSYGEHHAGTVTVDELEARYSDEGRGTA